MSTPREPLKIPLIPAPSSNPNLHFALARVALLLDESRRNEWYPDLARSKEVAK
jgi:hypothetical protein